MRDKVQDYLNAALPVLNLTQWQVKVSPETPEEGSWADIEVSENLWQATIRVSEDFFAEPVEHQRRILAHEIVHIHQASVERLVHSLSGVLGSQAYEMLDKLWDVETERVAEAMSFVIAECMPLPSFKGKRRA